MHVMIDDSGDDGMKFTKGSSNFLVMAAAIFFTPAEMNAATSAIEQLKTRLHRGYRWEFKYVKTSTEFKDRFFEVVPSLNFFLRAIIIDKTKLDDEFTRALPVGLKAWAIMMLLSNTNGVIENGKIVIDGQNRDSLGKNGAVYLRKEVNRLAPGTIKDITFKDSARDPLVQLADMAAGAIHREARNDGDEAKEYLRILKAKAGQPNGSLWYYN